MTADTLGYLLFTSGTSGAPKACLCSQGRLARIGAIVAQMYELTPEDVCYLSMPLFHSNALDGRLGAGADGGPAFALPLVRPLLRLGIPPRRPAAGVTYFNYVGKPLSYILATPEHPDDADNPLRRAFGNEGGRADVARFAERFGCTVTDSYGSTEGGATVQRTPDTPRALWAGRPRAPSCSTRRPARSVRPARFDATGRLLNAEEAIGELVSKAGGAGFEGYWRNDEAERARCANGWYWTGDLAYRDEAGFFYFAGRDHDWLRVDGENFAVGPDRADPAAPPRRGPGLGLRRARPRGGRPGHGRPAAPPGRGHIRPGRARRLPGRPGGPRDQVGAPVRADDRRACR